MKAFAYARAASTEEALRHLEEGGGGATILAGGSDLLARMKDRVAEPDRVVSVVGIEELSGIEATGDDEVRIGAAVRLSALIGDATVTSRLPAVVQAVERVGSPQIRNVATVGGNLLQRPRCWYLRQEAFSCLKKSGKGCPAIEGDHRHHAILAGGTCPIVHPSSLAVPLVAHGATFDLVGPGGERSVEAEAFFRADEAAPERENVLADGEMLVAVRVPAHPAAFAEFLANSVGSVALRSASYEARQRQSHDWPMAQASAVLAMEGDVVRAARVVLGHVAPVPWRATAAERALVGKSLTTPGCAELAAAAALEAATPLSGNRHKVPVARAVLKRAVLRAAGLAEEA